MCFLFNYPISIFWKIVVNNVAVVEHSRNLITGHINHKRYFSCFLITKMNEEQLQQKQSKRMHRFLASVFTKFSYQIEHSKNQFFWCNLCCQKMLEKIEKKVFFLKIYEKIIDFRSKGYYIQKTRLLRIWF